MKLKDFSKIYGALLFFHLVTIYKPDDGILIYLSKPLLLFSLSAYWWSLKDELKDLKVFKLILLALVFSLIGDISLMLSYDFGFILGMGFFLLAQALYSSSYMKLAKLKLTSILLASPLIITGIYLVNFVLILPAEMIIPINVYALSLSLHMLYAVNYCRINFKKNQFAFYGAALFFVSDLMIAFNKFQYDSIEIAIAVMLTYGLAQYFIVLNFVKNVDSK